MEGGGEAEEEQDYLKNLDKYNLDVSPYHSDDNLYFEEVLFDRGEEEEGRGAGVYSVSLGPRLFADGAGADVYSTVEHPASAQHPESSSSGLEEDGPGPGIMPRMAEEDMGIFKEAAAFEGVVAVSMVSRHKRKLSKDWFKERMRQGGPITGKSASERVRSERKGKRRGLRGKQWWVGPWNSSRHAQSEHHDLVSPGSETIPRNSEGEASAHGDNRTADARLEVLSPFSRLFVEGGIGEEEIQEEDGLAWGNRARSGRGGAKASSAQELARLDQGGADVESLHTDVAEGPEPEMERVLMITMEDGVTLEVALDSGEKRLIELGYTQELRRVVGLAQLYGVGVSFMSVFTGIVPVFGQTLLNGGPGALVWFWWVSAFFVHLVALSFAEISSSFPTAGSLYFWAAALASPKWSATAAFFTGWFQYIGSSAGAAGASYGGATVVQNLVLISTGTTGPAGEFSNFEAFGLAAAIIVLSTLAVLMPVEYVAGSMLASAVIQILGGIALIISVPWVSPVRQPASWVFGTFQVQWDMVGTPNTAYAVVLGLLFSQYSLYEYDGVAHLAEEARVSDVNGPVAIVACTSTVSVLAWGIAVALTTCIPSIEGLFAPDTITGGNQPVIQILWDAFYGRYQTGVGAQLFTGIILISFIFATVAAMLGSSRVSFALSRDNGFPFSRACRKVTAVHRVPVYGTLLSAGVSLVFLLPLLITATVFNAIISISTVAWVGAYGFPIFFRLIQDEKDFKPGPFYLPDYLGLQGGKLVHALALFWIVYTTIVFNLPVAFPVDPSNFNWTPVAIASLALVLCLWWIVDARHWFLGPVQGLQEHLHHPYVDPP